MKKTIEKIQNNYICINPYKCTGCWKCIKICPKQVICKVGFLWHKHIILGNLENCIGCKKCLKICPHGVFNEIQTTKKTDFE
jgi:Fe-S-cluster-containing hydrogenase component 2